MAWGRELVVVAVEWEGVRKGGYLKGLGMNEEGRRALGRERPTVYRRRFLGTVCPAAVCPRPMSLSPSPVTVSVMVSWHWARPHVSFGFRFTSSTGSTSCRNSFDLSFPCSSARRMSARPGSSCLLYPSSRTATRVPPSLTLSAFLQ